MTSFRHDEDATRTSNYYAHCWLCTTQIQHQAKASDPKVKARFREVRLLGSWWVTAALGGTVQRIPLVSV